MDVLQNHIATNFDSAIVTRLRGLVLTRVRATASRPEMAQGTSSPRTALRVVATGVAIAVAAIIAIAVYPREARQSLEQQLIELQRQTMPVDAELVESAPIMQAPYGVTACWEFTTHMARPAYLEWVTPRLSSFRRREDVSGPMIFVLSSGGDNFAVIIDALPSAAGARVRITWEVSAG